MEMMTDRSFIVPLSFLYPFRLYFDDGNNTAVKNYKSTIKMMKFDLYMIYFATDGLLFQDIHKNIKKNNKEERKIRVRSVTKCKHAKSLRLSGYKVVANCLPSPLKLLS
jgi:hypothetical protein